MTEEQKQERAEIVAQSIGGIEVMDAVDIIGMACNACFNKGDKLHVAIPFYHIAKLVSEANGEKGVVKINKDGSVSFSIHAGNKKILSV